MPSLMRSNAAIKEPNISVFIWLSEHLLRKLCFHFRAATEALTFPPSEHGSLNFLPSSHTVRRKTVKKGEGSEIPSLPRGGGDELVRDEQVSSRRVRRSIFIAAAWKTDSTSQFYCKELSWHYLVAMALVSMPACFLWTSIWLAGADVHIFCY